MRGITTTLEDEVRDLPGGKIGWLTRWELCWDEYPKAESYELQVVTSEGTSPKLRRQSDRCFRLEVARGENPKSQGFAGRDVTLAMQSGQLAYRVRAVLAGARTSEWSRLIEAGSSASAAAEEEADQDELVTTTFSDLPLGHKP